MELPLPPSPCINRCPGPLWLPVVCSLLSVSVGRELELCEVERAPAIAVRIKDVEVIFARVDGVDEGAEGATNPVRLVAKAGTCSHLRSMSADSCLLVYLLHLASVEDEGLLALTSEDQHIGAVKLNAAARLSPHKF